MNQLLGVFAIYWNADLILSHDS